MNIPRQKAIDILSIMKGESRWKEFDGDKLKLMQLLRVARY